MTDDERLAKIHEAQSNQQLDDALAGYHEQIIANYAGLARNVALNVALERKRYFHALCDIKRAARGQPGGSYQTIIRVLESAAKKQFALNDA